MQEDRIRVVVKNPSNFVDFEIPYFPIESNFSQLKDKLSQDYEGKPDPSTQKIIYRGRIAKDNETIKQLLEEVKKRSFSQLILKLNRK